MRLGFAKDLFGGDAEEPHPGRVCSPEINDTPATQDRFVARERRACRNGVDSSTSLVRPSPLSKNTESTITFRGAHASSRASFGVPAERLYVAPKRSSNTRLFSSRFVFAKDLFAGMPKSHTRDGCAPQ
jgi:hypothetical protein